MSERQESTYKNAVISIQRYLRQILHRDEQINKIPIDGIYGEHTRKGVMEFQKSNGLPSNGTVDRITWDMLYSEYQKSISDNSSAGSISPFFDRPSDYEIKLGDNNTLVSILEIIIEEIATIYTDIFDEYSLEKNGVYDKSKENFISSYQKINLLPVTGSVDRQTWNRLSEDFNVIQRNNS